MARFFELDLDLLAVEQEKKSIYDHLFPEPPVIDTNDQLDGENLELVQGTRCDEFHKIREGDLILSGSLSFGVRA